MAMGMAAKKQCITEFIFLEGEDAFSISLFPLSLYLSHTLTRTNAMLA